mgnify:CR=1 FL=1
MGLTIDNENLFKQAITDGVNLFVGAGFSLLAKDADGKQLPLGGELNEELRTHFGKNSILPLPQLCTILEKSNKEAFHNYLKNRFSVKYIDTRYYSINKLNIRSSGGILKIGDVEEVMGSSSFTKYEIQDLAHLLDMDMKIILI